MVKHGKALDSMVCHDRTECLGVLRCIIVYHDIHRDTVVHDDAIGIPWYAIGTIVPWYTMAWHPTPLHIKAHYGIPWYTTAYAGIRWYTMAYEMLHFGIQWHTTTCRGSIMHNVIT